MAGGACRRAFAGARHMALTVAAVLPAASDVRAEGDPAFGAYLSTQCVTCHSPSAHPHAGIPPIVGMPADAFVDALLAYKSGERDNQVMRSVAGALGVEEIAALAAYFARLSPQ